MIENWFADPAEFHSNGGSHLVVLGGTVALIACMCLIARGKPPVLGIGSRLELGQSWVLAVILFLSWPLKLWTLQVTGGNPVLPMHLCNWAAIAGAVALIFRRPLAAELVYFWGLAGTLQGLLTPDLSSDFPDPRFFLFFALHSGVVIAAVYVVVGLRLFPRPNAVWRMFGWTQVYVAVAFAANLAVGRVDSIDGNYAFLMHKPVHADNPLLNALGPYPWYILGLEAVSLAFFFVLNLPFWILRRRTARK